MNLKRITPALHLADFCVGIILLAVTICAMIPFATYGSGGWNELVATILISFTAVGFAAIVLSRGARIRAAARDFSRTGGGVVLAFDAAQIQGADRSLLRDLSGGLIGVRGGDLVVTEAGHSSPSYTRPVSDVVGVQPECVVRFVSYSLLIVEFADGTMLCTRPIKQSGCAWRSGLTRREVEAAATRWEESSSSRRSSD